MTPPDPLEIHLHEDPRESSVKTSSGALVPGVTRIEIVQSGDEPPRACLSVELLSLQARIYADQCEGTLDSNTVDVLMRLPARVLAGLAKEMQIMADDATQIELRAKARFDRKKPDNAGESL